MNSVCLLFPRNTGTQGAGEAVDPPKKLPMPENGIFGFGTTWGTTFTKVILLGMAEASPYFRKKTFRLLNKIGEGSIVQKSLQKRKRGKNR